MNNALRSLAGHTPQELATGTRAVSMFDQRKEACATGFGGATKDRMRAFEEARVAVLKHTTVEAYRAASKDHRKMNPDFVWTIGAMGRFWKEDKARQRKGWSGLAELVAVEPSTRTCFWSHGGRHMRAS